MIPTHIIEKAIAGGWKYPGWLADSLCNRWTLLDSDFWMALGKEMGWDKDWFPAPDSCQCELAWEEKAMQFYHLILRKASQEEITQFWKSL